MEHFAIAPQGRQAELPMPVKRIAPEDRSVSTRCPSDLGGGAMGPRGSHNRVLSFDDLDGSDFEPAEDDLLEDAKEEAFPDSRSPSCGLEENDCRGGFNGYNQDVNMLTIDFDEDTPVFTPDAMFVGFLSADDKTVGCDNAKMNIRNCSFTEAEMEHAMAAATSAPLMPVPPATPKGENFRHVFRRRTETPAKEVDETHSCSSSFSSDMAGAAGHALLRWRRCGRTSPMI